MYVYQLMGVFYDRLELGSTAALDCQTGHNKSRYHKKELSFLRFSLFRVVLNTEQWDRKKEDVLSFFCSFYFLNRLGWYERVWNMYEVKMDSWQKMKDNEKKTITLCMSECGMGAYDSASLRFDFNSHHTQWHKIIFSFLPNGAFHVI